MKATIKRSPAGACWWIMVNGVLVDTACKRYEAVNKKNFYVKQLLKLGI